MVGTRSARRAHDPSAGRALKMARRARRLTLDDVAVKLRIPPRQLKSLEEGDLSNFSAEVYARGAYTKYARYLGVDEDEHYRSFLRSLSGARERVPLKLPQTSTWLKRVWTPAGVLIISIAGSLLMVAGYLAWQVQSFVRVPALTLLEPTEVVLSGSSVTVVGWAQVESSVSVNGETVLLEDDGKFRFDLPLKEGINVLIVEATGVSGRTHAETRRLLVPRT